MQLSFASRKRKLNFFFLLTFLAMCGPAFDDFRYLPSDGTHGGILTAWDSSKVAADSRFVGEFSVSVWFNYGDSSNFWITSVYGPQGATNTVFWRSSKT